MEGFHVPIIVISRSLILNPTVLLGFVRIIIIIVIVIFVIIYYVLPVIFPLCLQKN